MGRHVIDLTNKKFGDIIVIKRVEVVTRTKRGNSKWKCKCICGNTIIKESSDLKKILNKKYKSNCGKCYQNDYIIEGSKVKYFTKKKEEFTFDLMYLEKVKKYIWHKNNEGYICGSNGKKLHRYILSLTNSNNKVDHIDNDKTNNLESNLRICNDFQNSKNKIKTIKKCTSKYKGVYKRGSKWICSVSCNYKKVHYSSHETEIEAAKMYNKIAPLFHGEYCNLNKV